MGVEFKATEDKNQEIAALFASVFKSEIGSKALNILKDITINKGTLNLNHSNPEIYMAYRAGQNDMVFLIEKYIKLSEASAK